MVHSLSTIWYRYDSRGAPSSPRPLTKVPAHVRPRMRSPSSAGFGSTAATRSRGDTSTPRTLTGLVLSRPRRCRVRNTSMKSSPRPYLNVTRSSSSQRGISTTSSCSTLTQHKVPMSSGNTNISGSLNGAVVNRPRPRSQISGGLRHSSIVVQMLNVGANSNPSITRSLPSRTPTSVILLNR